jgi:hypothetical protein
MLKAANKTKAVVRPILTQQCSDQVQLDLIDFQSLADGQFKWILQIKDTFSRYIWLYPLEEKTAKAVYNVLVV